MSETPGADTLELTPGERLIEGAREALAIARGEIPAARITINGHAYVPETELASLRAEKEELRRERDEARAPKLWCLACGTVTQDRQCDCTIFDETADLQNLVNYEDELRSEARKAHARAEAAESLLAEAGKALDDDAIMEIICEVAPWKTEPQFNDLLTYEKTPPLFPQATYDVPSYRAKAFVQAVERRIRAALSGAPQAGDSQGGEDA